MKKLFLALFFLTTVFFPYRAGCASDGENGIFKVALTGKYPPFSFYSHEGTLTGFDVDVSKKIASHLKKKAVFVATEWDGILAGLLARKYDVIIGSMAITPEREKQVNFSVPYYTSGAQLFVRSDRSGEIRSVSDLRGKRVGVGLGETYEHYLENRYPRIETVTYKSTVDIFQDMLIGRIDGFVTDKLVGSYQIRSADMPFVAAGPLLYKEKIGIPVRKDDALLLKQINKAVLYLEKTGEIAELHEKWFGVGERNGETKKQAGMSGSVIVRKLAKGFGITLFVAFISLAFGFTLALPWGIALNNSRFPLYGVFRFADDFVRGTPLLIQLFFVYFGAPQMGVTLSPIQSAVITLTLNSAAYLAEVVRSGLMSVDRGQTLAGRALGLSRLQVFSFVVGPQAFRVALPPLMNSVVAFLKDTTLISVICVSEVIREAQSIISVTYNPMKYYFIVAVMFFAFTFPLMKLAGRIERKIKQRGFSHD